MVPMVFGNTPNGHWTRCDPPKPKPYPSAKAIFLLGCRDICRDKYSINGWDLRLYFQATHASSRHLAACIAIVDRKCSYWNILSCWCKKTVHSKFHGPMLHDPDRRRSLLPRFYLASEYGESRKGRCTKFFAHSIPKLWYPSHRRS